MFVCTVNYDHTTFNVAREGSAHFVLVPIGYDIDDRDVSYFADVGFDAQAGGDLEMFFFIIEIDHETGGEYHYWCGRDTSSFILGSDRERVLEAVCFATHVLIREGAPDQFDMVTYDENPPDKAVKKHLKVMGVFERNGYEIQTFPPHNGKRYWRLVRAKG